VGDFNNWDVDNLPMKKANKGTWETSSLCHLEGMSTVSGLMESGMMTPMPRKGLKILLEAKTVSD